MRVQQILENQDIQLDEKTINIAKSIKKTHPNLPFEIKNSTLLFDKYTVGTIQIKDILIEILPRNPVFDSSTIFEMMMYCKGIQLNDIKSSGFNCSQKNFLMYIPYNFVSTCKKLTNFGLTGAYKRNNVISDRLEGDLIYEKFNKAIIKVEGIHSVKQIYSLDVAANQLIKSALIKISKLSCEFINNMDYLNTLKYFDEIKEYVNDTSTFKNREPYFFSSNPYYPEAIETALIILNDIGLNFSDGNLEWSSFLQNSNSLFEAYARKIIKESIALKVEKWNFPVPFATLNYKGNSAIKSYAPDILIEFDEKSSSSKIVLDVKNKRFNPDAGNLANAIESSDLYQLLFYCRQLHTNLGGLIYPSDKDYEPVTLTVSDDKDLRLVLYAINMKLPYSKRVSKIKTELEKTLLYYL